MPSLVIARCVDDDIAAVELRARVLVNVARRGAQPRATKLASGKIMLAGCVDVERIAANMKETLEGSVAPVPEVRMEYDEDFGAEVVKCTLPEGRWTADVTSDMYGAMVEFSHDGGATLATANFPSCTWYPGSKTKAPVPEASLLADYLTACGYVAS